MEEYLNEKEQWERVLAWLREQGPWIVAGVAIAAAVFGGWRFWQNRTEQRNLAAATRYEQVIDAFSRNDVNGGFRLADELVQVVSAHGLRRSGQSGGGAHPGREQAARPGCRQAAGRCSIPPVMPNSRWSRACAWRAC